MRVGFLLPLQILFSESHLVWVTDNLILLNKLIKVLIRELIKGGGKVGGTEEAQLHKRVFRTDLYIKRAEDMSVGGEDRIGR